MSSTWLSIDRVRDSSHPQRWHKPYPPLWISSAMSILGDLSFHHLVSTLFFSHAHRSFSRIDYFLVDKTLIPSLISVQYLPITVSDHAAVILDLHFDRKPKQFRFWSLDPLLLRDEKLTSDSISNKNVGTSLLWDTLKAFLRGKIISFSSHANKQRRKRKEELEKLISDIDR